MLTLPTVNIQPDLPAVVRDVNDAVVPEEHVWVSCYATESVHVKLNVVLDERNRDQVNFISDTNNVELTRIHDTAYSVSCTSLAIPPTTVLTPVQQYSDPDTSNPRHPQRITAFDLSPDSTQYAVGHLDGSVYIYPTLPQQPTLKKRAKPNLSAVSSLRFFPSSRVLLTAGIDFSLTILPADSGSGSGTRITPARTLRAHTRAITATGIINPGKTILSASLDSTAKLWDIPSGATTPASTCFARSPIQSMALTDDDNTILCGLQSGQFELFDVRAGSSVFRSSAAPAEGAAALSAMANSGNWFATGSTKGVVALYDLRSLSSALATFRRNGAGVEDLCFLDEGLGLAVATSDGLPFVAGLSDGGSDVKVAAELAGVDCDAVRSVRARARHVWCASDDAVVRKWLL